MNTEERAHIESLLQFHRAHLRELELKAAKYGDLDVPTHVTLQIAEYRQKIAELEERMHENLPCHNLPPRDYERFVGRQKELADVQKLLRPYPQSRYHLVTVDGIGGIGKSALALETAYTYVDQYAALPETERFEAIVWVSAKRSYLTADGILERRQVFRTLDDLYATIAQVFDYPAIVRARAEEQPAIVDAILREQRTLLILDNLETVDDEDLLAFLHELPDPTKALVTTRHRIDVARPVRLTGMQHQDALALIAQETERKEITLTVEEQEALWQRTGGVPLAIVWSVGLMGLGGSIESVLRRLGSGQSDIARFCFEESVAQVRGRDAYWLLLALSLFASDASREAVGVVAGLGEDAFGRDMGLEDLLRLSLVNKEGERFSLLPLTRSFVQSEAGGMAVWMEAARERWQQYYYQLAEKVRTETDWREHDQIERELPNIQFLISQVMPRLHYDQLDDGELALDELSVPQAQQLAQFIVTVARTCRNRGYWKECEEMWQTAIKLARLLNDTIMVGDRYYDLGNISFYREDFAVAEQMVLAARAEWERCGHERRIYEHAQRLLGMLALSRGKLDEAEVLLTEALAHYRRIGGIDGLPNLMSSLGDLAARRGQISEAAAWYQQAIHQSEQQNDVPNNAANTIYLGMVKYTAGQKVEAQDLYDQGLRLAQECGRADLTARALLSLGELEHAQDHRDSAPVHTLQALDLFRRLGMKREQAEAEALLARINSEASSS
jgi:tetratricopeptide (TPR) repeat protein